MIRNVLNQFECKIGKAGEILCNTDDTGNVLLFVSSGKLVIYNRNHMPVADVDEGYFVLLPAEKSFIATAITSTRLILMHAAFRNDNGRPGMGSGSSCHTPYLSIFSQNLIPNRILSK